MATHSDIKIIVEEVVLRVNGDSLDRVVEGLRLGAPREVPLTQSDHFGSGGKHS